MSVVPIDAIASFVQPVKIKYLQIEPQGTDLLTCFKVTRCHVDQLRNDHKMMSPNLSSTAFDIITQFDFLTFSPGSIRAIAELCNVIQLLFLTSCSIYWTVT